jgi:6,7-dimethyl-8-ribityllumazine synthase
VSDRYETDTELGGRTPYDHSRWEDSDEHATPPPGDPDEIDAARENVLADWPDRDRQDESEGAIEAFDEPGDEAFGRSAVEPARELEPDSLSEPAHAPFADIGYEQASSIASEPEPAIDPFAEEASEEPLVELESPFEPEAEADSVVAPSTPGIEAPAEPAAAPPGPEEHAPGELTVPPGYAVLEGVPNGGRRAVGIVVSRFNGDVTTRLLESALAALDEAGVTRESITVMPVPGAFELPLAAMALAKTRRFACVVALGCIIRGDTAHFEYVAGEAASGIQLAALETGVPVAFGVLTLESEDQAEARIEKGAEAVRTGLEMADLFANLRAAAAQ